MSRNYRIEQDTIFQMLLNETIGFELPATGVKIAVNVIDQTGIEQVTTVH